MNPLNSKIFADGTHALKSNLLTSHRFAHVFSTRIGPGGGSFDLARPGGVISAIGVHTAEQFSFSPTAAYDKNVTYKTGRCPVRSYLDRLLKLVQDDQLRIPVEQIVTESRLSLSQGEAAYRQFASRSGDCVKILLDPRAAG